MTELIIFGIAMLSFILGFHTGRKVAQRSALREIDAFYEEASQTIRRESD